MLRRLVYNVSTQKYPFNFSAQMYGQYRAYCERHVAEHVLPALRGGARGKALLRELLSRWDRHAAAVRWLSRFFNYLDKYYVVRYTKMPLKDLGVRCFCDGVRSEPGLERAVADAAAEVHGGEQADAELAKRVNEVLEQLGLSTTTAAAQHEAQPAAAAAE